MRFLLTNEERSFTTMCEVIEKDEEKVRSRSKLSTLAGLVLDGQLSAKDATAKASVSVSYFEAYKQGFVEGALQKGIQIYHNMRKRGISKEEALAIADIPADAIKDEE